MYKHFGYFTYKHKLSLTVTHPSTNQTQRCLTSLIGREAVHSTWYGRWHEAFVMLVY